MRFCGPDIPAPGPPPTPRRPQFECSRKSLGHLLQPRPFYSLTTQCLLHQPRPFYSSTTRLPTPASVICNGIPVTDATPTGYGGVFLHDTTLFYFAGQWPRHFHTVHIDVYEAVTVLLAAATWSAHLHLRQRIFQCDNKNSVFALNVHSML